MIDGIVPLPFLYVCMCVCVSVAKIEWQIFIDGFFEQLHWRS